MTETDEAAHESPLVILIPLGVLAIGSLGAGFAFKEFFAGHEVEHFFLSLIHI